MYIFSSVSLVPPLKVKRPIQLNVSVSVSLSLTEDVTEFTFCESLVPPLKRLLDYSVKYVSVYTLYLNYNDVCYSSLIFSPLQVQGNVIPDTPVRIFQLLVLAADVQQALGRKDKPPQTLEGKGLDNISASWQGRG